MSTPPSQIAAVRQSLARLHEEPDRVRRLQENSSQFRAALEEAGFEIYGRGTQIVPLACDSDDQAFAFAQECRRLGLFVVPIVYPAVPADRPRIRTNLTAMHTQDDLRLAVEILTQAARNVHLWSKSAP